MSDPGSSFFDKFGQNERSGVGGRQLGGLLTSPNSSVHHGGGLSPNSSQRNNQNEPATPNPIPSYDYETSSNQYISPYLTNRSTSPILESSNSFTHQQRPAINPIPLHNIQDRFRTTNRQYGASSSKAVVNTEATLFTPNETLEDETPRFYGNTPPGTIVVKKREEENSHHHHHNIHVQHQQLPQLQQQQQYSQHTRLSQYQPPPPRMAPFATDRDLTGDGGGRQSHAAPHNNTRLHQHSPSPINMQRGGGGGIHGRPSNVVLQLQPQHLRAVGPSSSSSPHHHHNGGGNYNNENNIEEHLSYNSPLRVAVRLELENALRNTRQEEMGGAGGGEPPAPSGDINHEDEHHHQQYYHQHPPAADFYEIKPNPLHNQRVGAAAATARQNSQSQTSSPKPKSIPRASNSPTYRRNLEPIRSTPVTSSALSSPPKPPARRNPPSSLPPSPLAPVARRKEGTTSPLVANSDNTSPHYQQQLPAVQVGHGGGTLRSAINNSPQKSGHATSLYTSSPSKRLLDSILGPNFEVKVENRGGGRVLKY